MGATHFGSPFCNIYLLCSVLICASRSTSTFPLPFSLDLLGRKEVEGERGEGEEATLFPVRRRLSGGQAWRRLKDFPLAKAILRLCSECGFVAVSFPPIPLPLPTLQTSQPPSCPQFLLISLRFANICIQGTSQSFFFNLFFYFCFFTFPSFYYYYSSPTQRCCCCCFLPVFGYVLQSANARFLSTTLKQRQQIAQKKYKTMHKKYEKCFKLWKIVKCLSFWALFYSLLTFFCFVLDFLWGQL